MTSSTNSHAADDAPLSSEWTKIGRVRFLEEMRASANLSRACDQALVTRRQALELRRDDGDFREAWDEAEAGAYDDLEEEVLRRARDGVDKPVYFGGKVCGNVRSYNDALALEILKLRRERLDAQRSSGPSETGEDGSEKDGRQSPIELIEDRLRRFEAAHPDAD